MPAYDVVCPNGHWGEIVCRVAEKDAQTCPACGESLRTRITSPPAIIGAVWDKKIHVGGSDRTFDSNASFRAYERELEMEGANIVSKGSSDWERIKWQANNEGEKAAIRAGYRDTDHFSRVAKDAVQRGGDPAK